ncbi:TetR family transcriptional regulator [Nocardia sp. NPDC058499]|uniref:TetR family transcriptional regulator n=1 Tax=Nocardia sp. NPDC058499 TaxID=3346530 RepID=UPI00364AFCED
MSVGAGQESETSRRILAVVADALERAGYDGVYLQDVARGARVSLSTIYKMFGTRDQLIIAALEQWMARTSYTDLAPSDPDEPLGAGLMRLFRRVFEPWERCPKMLEAYHKARTGPGGDRLESQGIAALLPAAGAVLAGADPDYLDDIGRVLTGLSYGLINRYAAGAIQITDILPTLEKAVHRLTTDNRAAAENAHLRRAHTPNPADTLPDPAGW